jgi:hypothetical protein
MPTAIKILMISRINTPIKITTTTTKISETNPNLSSSEAVNAEEAVAMVMEKVVEATKVVATVPTTTMGTTKTTRLDMRKSLGKTDHLTTTTATEETVDSEVADTVITLKEATNPTTNRTRTDVVVETTTNATADHHTEMTSHKDSVVKIQATTSVDLNLTAHPSEVETAAPSAVA